MGLEHSIPEATASAVTANKLTGGGFSIVAMGWLSNTTNIALIGLGITVLGGLWSFLSWMQSRADKKAKRREEAEEHALRMKVLAAELLAQERAALK